MYTAESPFVNEVVREWSAGNVSGAATIDGRRAQLASIVKQYGGKLVRSTLVAPCASALDRWLLAKSIETSI